MPAAPESLPPPLPVAPPPRIVLRGGRSLERADPKRAESAAAAINASRQHLLPWMPWAAEPATVAGMATFFSAAALLWEQRQDFTYSMLDPAGSVIGGCGLHNRLGPGTLEIGYWVRLEAAGSGLATEAAAALTAAGLGLKSVARLEIRCEEHNHRSARVPEKLGYTFGGLVVPTTGPTAGSSMQIWVITEPEWAARTP